MEKLKSSANYLGSDDDDRQEEGSTFDELSMQQSLIFSDCLKDLKTLRSQLYSAAEYFELAYTKDNQKQIVMNTLKDYAVKAVVNTVDHLGSISFKVNNILDEKFYDVTDTELRVSCIEQRIRTCRDCMDREGLSQQSSIITAPKYHKRYILPGGLMPDAGMNAVPNYRELNNSKNNSEPLPSQDVRPKPKEKHSSFRKLRSMHRASSQRTRSSSPGAKVRSLSPTKKSGKFSSGDKRSESPLPQTNAANMNPLNRSLSRKPSLLKSASVRSQHSSELQKLSTLLLHAERNDEKEGEHNTPKKSRKFLKSLLSRRKSRKDETLYSYLDEY